MKLLMLTAASVAFGLIAMAVGAVIGGVADAVR